MSGESTPTNYAREYGLVTAPKAHSYQNSSGVLTFITYDSVGHVIRLPKPVAREQYSVYRHELFEELGRDTWRYLYKRSEHIDAIYCYHLLGMSPYTLGGVTQDPFEGGEFVDEL